MKVLKLLLLVGILAMSTNVYAQPGSDGNQAFDTAVLNQTVLAALTFSLGADVTFTKAGQGTAAATKTLTATMAGTSGETVTFTYDTSVTMTNTGWTGAGHSNAEIVVTVVDTGFASGGSGNSVTLTGGVAGGDIRLSRASITSTNLTGAYNKTMTGSVIYNGI